MCKRRLTPDYNPNFLYKVDGTILDSWKSVKDYTYDMNRKVLGLSKSVTPNGKVLFIVRTCVSDS